MADTVAARIRPVIIGIGFTILLLAGLAYIASQRRNVTGASTPQLTIVTPAPGMQIDSPLVIRFTSASPIVLHPSGWGAGNLHLHARINGVEFMPAAQDIRQEAEAYLWTIPSQQAGPVAIRLGWADQAHRELSSGATDTVSAILR